MAAGPGPRLLALWRRLSPLPGGKWLFSRLVGREVRYSGSIRALVTHLEPGHARLELPDRPAIRNHLRSIHAIALVNLGEFTSGLAMLVGLPATVRGIVTGLEIDYLKKARGRLVAECRTAIPATAAERTPFTVEAEIRDPEGDVVARARVHWLLGPVEGEGQWSRVKSQAGGGTGA